MKCKGYERKQLWPNLRYYFSTGNEENHKKTRIADVLAEI
jgi:hypothetical protein